MGYGGYHPFPRRFGGGKPRLKVIHESLNAQRGDGIDVSHGTEVWIENMAFARAIYFSGWESNRRLSLQWDPLRLHKNMIPRWETIFGIPTNPAASLRARRLALWKRWQRFGQRATHSVLTAILQREIPDYFMQIEYIGLSNANVHVPDGSYPWGTVVDGITWYSTVAHILVRLQKPDWATWAEFYEAAGRVVQELHPIVPAWVTIDWYRGSTCGAHIDVPDGPSAAGFYLDCPHNLDNQVFDV